MILIRFRGAQFRRSAGEVVEVKFWNAKKKRCNTPKEYTKGNTINETLDKMELAVTNTIQHYKTFQNLPTATEFWDTFDSFYFEDYKSEKSEPVRLIDYLDRYILDAEKRLSYNTMKKYRSTLSRLKIYEAEKQTSLMLEDVDIKFYNDFRAWAYKKNYSANYFGVFINVIGYTD